MKIEPSMLIKETQYWTVNHRVNSALSGYIMLSSTSKETQLYGLPHETLIEMATLMSNIERALTEILMPKYLYIGRYGHTKNLAVHFHFIPINQWVLDLFWQDQRYRQLQSFGIQAPETATDGAELTFFIWREYCERLDPPPYQGLSRETIIDQLKIKLA